MKTPLIQYKVTFQFFSRNVNQSQDLYGKETLYDTYKAAKKAAKDCLKSAELENREIQKLTIEPVLLQENFT